MILIFIENYSFLTRVIDYLNHAEVPYTTDFNQPFTYLLLAEINTKTKGIIEEYSDKKVIFLTYLEEGKIYYHFTSSGKRSRTYRNKYHSFFQRCHKLIVSLPYFQAILRRDVNSISIIPRELPIINISHTTRDIYNKYKISKRKKKILVIDIDYGYLESMYQMAIRYPKLYFIYLGYKPMYSLTKREIHILHELPSNIQCIPYFDTNIFSDLCKIVYMVIDFNSYKLQLEYLYIVLLFKKKLLIFENKLYDDFLIPSKHYYAFTNHNDLFLRIDKILEDRVMDLGGYGYDLVKMYNYTEIVKRYRETLQ